MGCRRCSSKRASARLARHVAHRLAKALVGPERPRQQANAQDQSTRWARLTAAQPGWTHHSLNGKGQFRPGRRCGAASSEKGKIRGGAFGGNAKRDGLVGLALRGGTSARLTTISVGSAPERRPDRYTAPRPRPLGGGHLLHLPEQVLLAHSPPRLSAPASMAGALSVMKTTLPRIAVSLLRHRLEVPQVLP